MTDRKLRVFLCHASQDKPIVRELYQRLNTEGWIDPWLDEEKLLPGQDWDLEIEKAVESADVVIVCLSKTSVEKEGYYQKEIKKVLDVADEKPEGTIFIIPFRLNNCKIPRRLAMWQYVDYFPKDRIELVIQKLIEVFGIRLNQVGKYEIKASAHEGVEMRKRMESEEKKQRQLKKRIREEKLLRKQKEIVAQSLTETLDKVRKEKDETEINNLELITKLEAETSRRQIIENQFLEIKGLLSEFHKLKSVPLRVLVEDVDINELLAEVVERVKNDPVNTQKNIDTKIYSLIYKENPPIIRVDKEKLREVFRYFLAYVFFLIDKKGIVHIFLGKCLLDDLQPALSICITCDPVTFNESLWSKVKSYLKRPKGLLKGFAIHGELEQLPLFDDAFFEEIGGIFKLDLQALKIDIKIPIEQPYINHNQMIYPELI
ncbi:MAG: TIR domain-containing protein [Anaerolineales bacterium]|nr:TIR domain-containing protein [Anaerolineales bacterium]